MRKPASSLLYSGVLVVCLASCFCAAQEPQPPTVTFSTAVVRLMPGGETVVTAMIEPQDQFSEVKFFIDAALGDEPVDLEEITTLEDEAASIRRFKLRGLEVGRTFLLAQWITIALIRGTVCITVGEVTPPLAVTSTTTPLIPAGGTAVLDGRDSHDTDAIGALPDIVSYHWTLRNLTTPTQAPIELFDPHPSVVLAEPGEYDAELIVTDGDCQQSSAASDSHVTIKVVKVTFNPKSVTVEQDKTAPTKATIVPPSAVGEVAFSVDSTAIATVDKNKLTASPGDLNVAGVAVGPTVLRAEITTNLGSATVGTAAVTVTPVQNEFIVIRQIGVLPDPSKYPAGTPGTFAAGVFTPGADGLPRTTDDVELPEKSQQLQWSVVSEGDSIGSIVGPVVGTSVTFESVAEEFTQERTGVLKASLGGLADSLPLNVRPLLAVNPKDETHHPFEEPNGSASGLAIGEENDPVAFVWTVVPAPLEIDPGPVQITIEIVVRVQGQADKVIYKKTLKNGDIAGAATVPGAVVTFSTNGGKLSLAQNAINLLVWNGKVNAKGDTPPSGAKVLLTITGKTATGKDVSYRANKNVEISKNLVVSAPNATVNAVGETVWTKSKPINLLATVDTGIGSISGNVERKKLTFTVFKADGTLSTQVEAESVIPPAANYLDGFTASHRFPQKGKYLIFAQALQATDPPQSASATKPLVVLVEEGPIIDIRPAILQVVDGEFFPGTLEVFGQGPAAHNFEWSAKEADLFPEGHVNVKKGFESKVEYSDPNKHKTKIANRLYWYATRNNPQDPTIPNPAKFRITCRWKEGTAAKEAQAFVYVSVPKQGGFTKPTIESRVDKAIWNQTDHLVKVPGSKDKWKIKDIPDNALERTISKTILVKPQSQFLEKAEAHENVHVQQMQTGILKDFFAVHRAKAFVLVRLKDVEFEGKTFKIALDEAKAAVQGEIIKFDSVETLDINNRIRKAGTPNLATIERPAYDVSDKVDPQYVYIGDDLLGKGNNGGPIGDIVPLSLENLVELAKQIP